MDKKAIPDDIIGDYLDMLMRREKAEKKDPNISYLPYYLCAIAVEMYDQNDNTKIRADRAALLMQRVNKAFGFRTPDTAQCLTLLVDMGILQMNDADHLSFLNEEYYNNYVAEALERGFLEIEPEPDENLTADEEENIQHHPDNEAAVSSAESDAPAADTDPVVESEDEAAVPETEENKDSTEPRSV